MRKSISCLISLLFIISCSSRQMKELDWNLPWVNHSNVSVKYSSLKRAKAACDLPLQKESEKDEIKEKCDTIDFTKLGLIEKELGSASYPSILIFAKTPYGISYQGVYTGGNICINLYNNGPHISAIEFIVQIHHSKGAFSDKDAATFTFNKAVYISSQSPYEVCSDNYSNFPQNIQTIKVDVSRIKYYNQ